MKLEVVDRNRQLRSQVSTHVVVCPQCKGHGYIRLEHSGATEECAYCRGSRVVEQRVHHQHYEQA